MRAALPLFPASRANALSAPAPHKILRFQDDVSVEEQADSEEIARLRAEIRALRDALHEAQRQIEQYETLLRNAKIREQELRARVVPGK